MEMICETGTIQSNSGVTFYTVDYFTSASEAKNRMSLPKLPRYRVGPIPASAMPPFDAAGHRKTDPANGHRGGAHECATTHALRIDGLDVRIERLFG
jgi:hypothetical protein